MRKPVLLVMIGVAGLLLVRNLLVMAQLPDEVMQGAIFRIIFFHVPAAWTAFLGFFAALVASILYLVRGNLKFDAFAVAVTEVGLAFGAANLISGMIWGREIWGIWWTWDPRLTSMLVCWLLYSGYLMLRRAVEEPTQRARVSAVFSIFAFADVPIVWFSIKWWRTQHPQPVVWGGGSMDPSYWNMLFLNWIPFLLLGLVFVAIRMRQESAKREIDAIRRMAHAI
ncbi:MAG: cytochrome c biogenesis protein CcsA [Bryobacterales bacterium]|nr:cytochrome c biogenesis protein CcsA [Bryobacterales bacterium]